MTDGLKKYFIETYGADLISVATFHQLAVAIGTPCELTRIEHPFYLCPLCLRNFLYFKHGEFFENAVFTEDHFPPQSVGGEKTVLVCKPCNSTYGSEMDYVLKEYLLFQGFLNKHDQSAYPLKFRYEGIPGKYAIETSWEKGNMIQKIPFKNYPLVKEWLLDFNKKEWKFTMNITAPSEKKIQMALLRAAYLWCFSNWGYDFVLSENGKHFRKVLSGEENHPLSNAGVFGDAGMKHLEPGFYFVSEPEDLQSIILNFDISIDDRAFRQRVFIIIPGRKDSCWNELKNFEPMIKKKTENFSLVRLYDDCVKRGVQLGYSKVWHQYFKKEQQS